MSQIALSAGMRNNLLSLQNTQSMLSKTQERLASGRKINSALDGPSNFFTAQGMTQRSNQLSGLLDSMKNGVQTIRAADQGFKSVTKLLDNLMSTARQARQDTSTNNVGGGLSFANGVNAGTPVAANAIDPATADNNSIRIGGTTVDLTTQGTTILANQEFDADFLNASANAGVIDFTVPATTSAVTVTVERLGTTITQNWNYSASGEVFTTAATTGGGAGNIIDPTYSKNDTNTLGDAAGEIIITGAGLGAVTVDLAADDTADDVVRKINAALDGVSGGQNVRAERDDDGLISMVDYTGGTSDLRVRNVSTQSGDNPTVEAIFGSTDIATLDNGGQPAGKAGVTQGTVALTDALIAERINSTEGVSDLVRASIDDNGALRIENLTLEDVTIEGINFAAVDGGNMPQITGDLTQEAILTPGTLGNSERRASMQQEFNTLIEQLDQTVRDAGFNGVNLLNGDSLRVVFNELTGADQSSINVRLNNADGSAFGGVSASSLGIETDANFQNNADLDSLIDSITNATSTVRDLNSQMSSNLSVVENRQDFTKGMVNILQTGADNLTLADMNEEAANSLALQTRQQLGQTAMSLTAQQDQSILALLR